MNYFITAIGTDSGKTLVSAILTEMLQCDYWKPIQSGDPRDTLTVKFLVSNKFSSFHSESYLLKTPASPHYSAHVDGVNIELDKILLPTNNQLVIEGAGGLLVPVNEEEVIADLISQVRAEVVLVSNLYLGSINHTLLTVEELKRRDLKVKGIIFNGESNPSSEEIILSKSGYPCLLRIPELGEVNKEVVRKLARELNENWK
ncbi:MAG: dethiobiotin synthase [Cyclobacteriaceae bacterium]